MKLIFLYFTISRDFIKALKKYSRLKLRSAQIQGIPSRILIMQLLKYGDFIKYLASLCEKSLVQSYPLVGPGFLKDKLAW